MHHAKLSNLQRLAHLGIAEAKKTTPTAAVEVFLGLLPLHLKTQNEALAGIYWLSSNEKQKPKSLGYEHVSKAWDTMREPILQTGTTKRN
jgi:hypothetical protein